MSAPIATATVITPCRNAATLIERTASSIVNQTAVRSGRVKLQYLVRDGGSTDGTLDVLREVCGDAVEIVSEPDDGMYDALAKGLRTATGEMVSYLNAGDYYAPGALEIAADVLEQDGVEWISGLSVLYDEAGKVVNVELPRRCRQRYLRKGLLLDPPRFPFVVQQESTFWRRELLSQANLEELATFRLAGDAYLWKCFAQHAPLWMVDAHLGGFTAHAGQLSEDIHAYRDEVARRLREPHDLTDAALALVDRVEYRYLPLEVREGLSARTLFRYSQKRGRWHRGGGG